ncbi:hypothetical protein [Moorena sp. SIO3I8]|uniref:hypothetical protein n=1 Tax=Moorena sp. SIO3I8 TaxID=2607833 RepID=UPI0013BED8DF|nr:hypothetical protein [Moorena sp. SIO3I8]NEO05954.1 hypothetical protein [Moorena sp. SIO3I8]
MVSSQRSAVSYQPSAYALWTCLELGRPSVEACATKILITGILVEWASWWNGHLGGTGILVEWASWWNGHLGGMGILVELASWWNGHLGGMGILVEWASWWNWHLGGMGILVEWASWWNGHLGGTGILPVSCLFWGGQDAHSTVIDPAGRMPTLLLFILFPIPDSPLPTPHSPKSQNPAKIKPCRASRYSIWWREADLNHRPSGYAYQLQLSLPGSSSLWSGLSLHPRLKR